MRFRQDRIDIRWTNPENRRYTLSLRKDDGYGWDIYYGGHPAEWAPVEFSKYDLSGTETLVGYLRSV